MAKQRSTPRRPRRGAAPRDHQPQPLEVACQEFARRRAAGEILVPPTMLSKEDRRLHIRRTLREDHEFRVQNRPEGAQAKFDKLATSAWTFFRGTALLYYRDYAGTDSQLPEVFCNGDVHPENFGVMPNQDGAPFFGLNDFDEAAVAPFSWDVKRGATGFHLACRERGMKNRRARPIARAFVDGYFAAMDEFARDDREKWHQFRLDNSPPLIHRLLERAQTSRREFLAGMIDLDKGRFRPTEEIVPHSSHVSEFQTAIDRYRQGSRVPEKGRAGHFHVKDVAVKVGSGTASLGLDRFFVLIDGPSDDPLDDIVLELKQARRSAMAGLSPHDRGSAADAAERVFRSHDVHLVGGDPYYGETTLDGRSFLVRERSPYKDSIDMEDLDRARIKEYARFCGMVLSQAHARSDADSGIMPGNAEQRILGSVHRQVFTDDVVRFARAATQRIRADYKLFKQDHALGAYEFVRNPWMEQSGD
jgi:uncharacterized protein (DUF2252 family)